MRRRSPFLPLVALVLSLALPAAAHAAAGGTAPPYTVDTPSARPHSIEGQDARYLLDGSWLMRAGPDRRRPRAALLRAVRHRRLEHDHGPERMERRRRQPGELPRLGRVVPQGLPPALARQSARLDRALRVGQLPRDGVAQRPQAGRSRQRLRAVRARPAERRPQRRQPPRRARRQPPPVGRPDRRARRDPGPARRLVELRRAAARGLAARRRPRRRRGRAGAAASCRARAARRRSRRARACATSRTRRSSCSSRGRFGRPPIDFGDAGDPGARASGSFARQLFVRRPRLWSPDAARTSTACGSTATAAQGESESDAGRRLRAAHRHPHARRDETAS